MLSLNEIRREQTQSSLNEYELSELEVSYD